MLRFSGPMHTILLTCGRGTYSLTLARAFHAAGHRVLVADAWPRSLCRLSAAVDRYFHVPSPARATWEWIPAIRQIVRQERVDLIVPVYEEVFYLAKANVGSSDPLPLFAPDFATLIALHDKWQFIQKSAALGLSVPDTVLLTSRDDLVRERLSARRQKPRFQADLFPVRRAHGGSSAESRGDRKCRANFTAALGFAGVSFWQTVRDIQHCPSGASTAHATYATDFNHDLGPTVVYRRADRPAIVEWVRRLVAATNSWGKSASILSKTCPATPAAIECNPRLTGGFYLLKDNPKAAAAYFEPGMDRIEASRSRSYAFRFWLFFTLFRHTKAFPGFREWARQIASARSTNAFTLSDPVPRLLGPLLATEFLLRCYREGKSFREMVTRDFEWSEDPDAVQQSALSPDHRAVSRTWLPPRNPDAKFQETSPTFGCFKGTVSWLRRFVLLSPGLPVRLVMRLIFRLASGQVFGSAATDYPALDRSPACHAVARRRGHGTR